MKKISIICLFILQCNVSFCQNTIYKVKLYNQISSTTKMYYQGSGLNNKYNSLIFFKLMPSFSFQKNKIEHEFIINTLSKYRNVYFNEYRDSNQLFLSKRVTKYFNFGINYISHYKLKIFKNDKIKTYLSLNLEPIFSSSSSKSNLSYTFPTNLRNLDINFYLQPRLSYKLNDKLNLEFNIPLNIGSISYSVNNVLNPAFNPQQQKTLNSEFSFFPARYQFNFGFALKI